MIGWPAFERHQRMRWCPGRIMIRPAPPIMIGGDAALSRPFGPKGSRSLPFIPRRFSWRRAHNCLVRVQVGELSFIASIVDFGERAMTVQFRAPKHDMHEAVLAAARERIRGEVFVQPDDGSPESEWRIVDSAFAYVGSQPWGVHHHTWRLEQVERLAVSRLLLGDLAFEPYEYREETSELSVLRLAARAQASEADLARLEALIGTRLNVVREGISAEPISMLFEGYVWGPSATHGQSVAVVCSEEPRVTLAGATPAKDHA